MKKFSLMMIALLCTVVTFAAGPKKQFTPLPFTPAKEAVQLSKQFNAKPAPAGLAMKAAKKSAKKMRAPKKVASGTTLAGDYNWDYVTVSEPTLRLDTMQTTAGSTRITIKETEREDSVIISGMSLLNDIYALIVTEDGVDYLVVPHQVAYVHPQAGNCSITGFFYYEGDDTYEEGWYYGSEIYGEIGEDGVITLSDDIFINAVVDGGQYAGYTILKDYFAPSSTFTPAGDLVAVTLPEGVEMKEYTMTYTDYQEKDASGTAYVGIDGTDVYIKGFSSYIPDALIKGTMDGNTVTFPGNQYLGTAYDYNSFFMEEAVFTYDAETDTYTAEGDVYSILGNQYIDVWATDPVLKGVSAAPAGGDFTFDFNALGSDWPVSTNVSQDGDITEAIELTAGDVTLTISPKTESATNPNRFWGTKNGPQLRVYSGTLTFTVPEGSFITAIDFSNNAKWNEGNSADTGEFDGTTWTGSAQTVVITIAANTQINAITVTVEGGEEPIEFNPDDIDLPEYLFDFNDLTMQGWTTIDADGDDNDWKISEGNGSGKTGCVISESYINDVGPLTPDNYLVSPKLKLDGCITFYAIAQDASYPAEHFSVEVSTSGNTDAADFKTVQEWTLTASRALRAPRKVQGNMYEYSVDLRGFEGQEGYVAIRHFNCTDNFYIVIDDIKIKTSWIELPDIAITPTEGRVESLKDFAITFNNYEVVTEGAVATLTNTTTGETASTEVLTQTGKTVSFSFDEFTASGNYTLTVSGVKKADGEDVELAFNYYILGVVELPEGLEAETWYFSASASESSVLNQEVAVAIDGSDIYIQGINIDYLPEAWVKGTIDAEAGTATFPTGQYFGAFEYEGEGYDMFFVGSGDGKTASDVVLDYDAETGTLTTDMLIVISSKMDAPSYYEYYYDVTITREPVSESEVVELPKDAEVETWYLYATNNDYAIVATEVGVAFVGDEVYVQGLCSFLPDAWVKGTIDGETATFATGQYYGQYGSQYDFFFVGYGEEGVKDVVFSFDAENGILSTDDIIVLSFDKKANDTYDAYYDVVISRDRPDSFPVEAPKDLVTETYTFKANAITASEDDDTSFARKVEGEEGATDSTFDFNAMEVATSSNSSTDGDINETLVLTEGDVTLSVSPKDENNDTPNRFWSSNNVPQLRVYSGTLTFEVPEGKVMTQIVFNNSKWNAGNSAEPGEFDGATWTGKAQTVVVTIGGNTQLNSIVVTVTEDGVEEPVDEPVAEEYEYQMQVGFDGNDVYFSGVNDNTVNMWMKGKLSEDGKTVTIPACQYMGQVSVLWYAYDYFITAMDETGGFADIVLNWDAENYTFTTDQTVVLNGYKDEWNPYQTFYDVVITKREDFAATPADPSIESYKFEGTNYPVIHFSIPTEDVDGNTLITSKLFYIVWVEEDGEEKPFTVVAEEYSKVSEDMTEIPYNYEDVYDIYMGGQSFYVNPTDAVANWTKFGIQSVYYGGGERNVSNIVWSEELTTGIANVNVDSKNAVIFDLQGRRVIAPAKGLYIVNGKKVVLK